MNCGSNDQPCSRDTLPAIQEQVPVLALCGFESATGMSHIVTGNTNLANFILTNKPPSLHTILDLGVPALISFKSHTRGVESLSEKVDQT